MTGESLHDDSCSRVQARWTAANGTEETALIQANDGLQVGDRVEIWLDRSGGVTRAPVSSTAAACEAVLAATVGWVGFGVLLAGIFWIYRRRLNKTRISDWETEWRRIGPHWTTL